MTNPTELPPTSGPATPSAVMTEINSWLTAIKASWVDSVNPPGMIDGLIQYFTPAGLQPRLRFRRSGAWAGILDDIGRETTNLNNAIEGGPRFFVADTPNAPFTQSGTALVLPRGGGVTQIACRQADADHAYIRSSLDGAGSSWTPWRRIFTQADIVGTVSRSGGVPNGAVLESDSLSSGQYKRTADGAQICHASRTLDRDSTDFSRLNDIWTFPRAFVDNDYQVQFTVRSLTAPGKSRRMLGTTSVGDTSTATQLRSLLYSAAGQSDFASGDAAVLDITVNGRWAAP